MAEPDETLLLRDLSRAMVAWRGWLSLRRASPSAAGERDPFASTRWVTEQRTLVEVRAKSGHPATPYLAGWMSRLLYARVNAEAETLAAMERETKSVRLTIPSPRELSVREAVRRLVSEPDLDVRASLGDALVRAGGDVAGRERDAWARRGEIARRLGFDGEGALFSPVREHRELAALASETLDTTHELARHALGRSARWTDTLTIANGSEPPLPWPGRLSMRALVELFAGEARWLDLPELVLGDGPALLVPASINRSLARLGARWADASASRSLPLPLAHAPSELPRRTLGALFAGLVRSAPFLVRVLGLSRSDAERAARAMAKVSLFAWRLSAARLLLREPALAGDARGVREAADTHVARALLAPFPTELALVAPRLTETDPARFVAFGEAARLAGELRDRWDEDWFRNPRAVITLRDRLGHAPPLSITIADARAGVTAEAATLGGTLS